MRTAKKVFLTLSFVILLLTACGGNRSDKDEATAERPSYYDEDFFTNEEEGKSFDYRYDSDTGLWEAVFTLYDVNIVREMTEGGRITLEYEGKSIEVPWAVMNVGAGQGMSYYKLDVTGDGYEDLVFLPYIREHFPVFVFDLKNWKDLSPFYCKDGDLYKGLYTYPKYSEMIKQELNEILERDGYETICLEEISGNLFLLNTRSVYGEDGLFKDGAFLYEYYRPGAFESEWWCCVSYSFAGGECTAGIVGIGTKE